MATYCDVVYVIPYAGLCKIGSSRYPERRVYCLGRELGVRLSIWGSVQLSEGLPRQIAFIVERRVHHRLKESRFRGEWFRISPEDALRIVREEWWKVRAHLVCGVSCGELYHRLDLDVARRRTGAIRRNRPKMTFSRLRARAVLSR